MYLADTAQIREADRVMIEERQYPGILLMETAGRKSAEYILQHYPDTPHFLIFAGMGNNGGDGLVIARILHLAGENVQLVIAGDPRDYKGDALINWKVTKESGVEWFDFEKLLSGKEPLDRIHSAETVIIDALLGTGIKGAVRGNAAVLLRWLKNRKPRIVSIDIPSGLNADTGFTENEIADSEVTLTFQLPKVAHFVQPAASHCGKVVVADIGIWENVTENLGIRRFVTEGSMVREWMQNRPENSHKGTFGHVLVAGGSRKMAGAIALAARSALKIGAGLSTAFLPGAARCALYAEGAEVMTENFGDDNTEWLTEAAAEAFVEAIAKKDVVAIGPGMGQGEGPAAFLKAVLPHIRVPLVLDADGLNILAANPALWEKLPETTILTPHPGEMNRLAGKTKENLRRVEHAEQLARERKVIVVLKGAGTIVALPNGTTYVNPSGNAGMATAGSGDVLTGALAGLLAQGYPPAQAVPMAVYLHGKAGDLLAQASGPEGVTAEGLMNNLSPALKFVRENDIADFERI